MSTRFVSNCVLLACWLFTSTVLCAETLPRTDRQRAVTQSSQPSSSTDFWSFRPLRTEPLPKVKNSAWIRSPVDSFVLSALERKGLSPTPAAARRKLIRRLYFDLVGLPPKPEEIEAFIKDLTPNAYEKLVDLLLDSPHYGERWGRHWLDLARYADSDGSEGDRDRPTAYHYRDFVIKALNDDLPFDTFVRWQIGGDEFEPDNPQAIAATGFLTAGPHAELGDNLMEEEKVRERYNELDDILSTTGQAFLGLTIGCARCHDHKYDPIPTRDYYRLLSIFNSCSRAEVPLLPLAQVAPRRAVEKEWREKLETAKKAGDKEVVKAVEAQKPEDIPTALGMADLGSKPRASWLLERGDFHRRKELVQIGFFTALTRGKTASAYWSEAKARGMRNDSTYQRRALAYWMTDTTHGAGVLLARVAVNRLWQGHFGEGLVRTVNDFGKRGEPPTHPELLEWLAAQLVRGGWKLKPIHRLIVLSAAYRQDTTFNPLGAGADPENRLLWRRRPRRIESEIFRDTMLDLAGTLNPEIYGPAFKPPIPAEAMQARNVTNPYPTDARDGPETRRRSVYMFHKRVVRYPLLQVFDGPDAAACCGRRAVTTVAPQALATLNERFIRMRAAEFAGRLRAEAGNDPAAKVQRAYRLALGRPPSPTEQAASVRFIARQTEARAARDQGTDARLLALTDFAQAIFGLNEFMYVD